jgi:hypothetical protein
LDVSWTRVFRSADAVLVTGAGIIKKRSTLARLALKSRVKQFIEVLPAFSLHRS